MGILEYIICYIIFFVLSYCNCYGGGMDSSVSLLIAFLGGFLGIGIWSYVDKSTPPIPKINIGGIEFVDSPGTKAFIDFDDERRKNGYSENMVKIADKVIKKYEKKKIPIDLISYLPYITSSAEYYSLNGDYDKALNYLNNISASNILEENLEKLIRMQVYAYLAQKMRVCRGLDDKNKAEKVLREGKQFLEKIKPSDEDKTGIDMCYYHYYMLIGEYEKARDCADRLLTYITIERKGQDIYLINAEIKLHFGEYEAARKMMINARANTEYLPKYYKQYFNYYLEKFGMEMEMKSLE